MKCAFRLTCTKYWNPEVAGIQSFTALLTYTLDVKYEQARKLLDSIVLVNSRHCPVVIAGDFNSQPHSAVYDLFTKQFVESSHPEGGQTVRSTTSARAGGFEAAI